ncbi:MAG: hypothetical protein CML75_00070, partial [Rhodobiaceae bacterium]|nr:hypothetical protein [Rhodobiaceae bacterium]
VAQGVRDAPPELEQAPRWGLPPAARRRAARRLRELRGLEARVEQLADRVAGEARRRLVVAGAARRVDALGRAALQREERADGVRDTAPAARS